MSGSQNSGTAAPVVSSGPSMSSPVRNGTSRDGQDSTDDGTEGEEQEESSSSHVTNDLGKPSDTRSNLREQCQQERQDTLALYDSTKPAGSLAEEHNDDFIIENMAKNYYLSGIEFEQKGKWYEAIQSYRRAVQLIPDIESRMYEASAPKQKEYNSNEENDNEKTGQCVEEEDEYQAGEDLMMHLQKVFSQSFLICMPNQEQSQTHISVLPMEIMLYILRWVVSSDLDLRALEICSEVCRGFYICCRDTGIWKLACARIWGNNCRSLTNYRSWRQMFIERPRLQFNGCYISKTTYIRHGENSFQDQFYRPWHMVEYYRYLRFFPEGRALMLTSSDEPQLSVTQLKYRTPRHSSILLGYYHLTDDQIVVKLQHTNNRIRTRKREIVTDLSEPTFRINLQIRSSRNHIHGQLIWKGYTITRYRAGEENDTNMDLSSNKYPPFWFSRVKSYTLESDSPL